MRTSFPQLGSYQSHHHPFISHYSGPSLLLFPEALPSVSQTENYTLSTRLLFITSSCPTLYFFSSLLTKYSHISDTLSSSNPSQILFQPSSPVFLPVSAAHFLQLLLHTLLSSRHIYRLENLLKASTTAVNFAFLPVFYHFF